MVSWLMGKLRVGKSSTSRTGGRVGHFLLDTIRRAWSGHDMSTTGTKQRLLGTEMRIDGLLFDTSAAMATSSMLVPEKPSFRKSEAGGRDRILGCVFFSSFLSH